MSTSESAAERAYAALRTGILNGTHRPGTMLGEAGVAAELGLSRTPVRAALVRLQDEGWITVYPKRGALVRGLDGKDVQDLADARLILESTAVQRTTPERRAALATRLEAEVDRQEGVLADGDLPGFIELTVAFHRSFVEAADNQVLLELNDRLADRQRFLLFSYGEQLMERCADIIAEHRALVARLAADDVQGFSDILRSHVGDTYGFDLRHLRV
ncbi:putative transcriptional regulator, GntR family protein [Kitasatospora phosalacinea]|uniref:Transcriptional regulator, GntR family protein n=1 Tax=Kitasatospora phosalacinea TaxID=2065 RepID=A0A9W6V3G1_9ACTN|nr:GntR family transcriptional regulator [Kitasatospora phosalacinea]GLW71060.1 putative transcriptional regulator, GntR family protein [Kitasatospora phosalacinea]